MGLDHRKVNDGGRRGIQPEHRQISLLIEEKTSLPRAGINKRKQKQVRSRGNIDINMNRRSPIRKLIRLWCHK